MSAAAATLDTREDRYFGDEHALMCYREDGDPAGTPLLLLTGLGLQLTAWSPALLSDLTARGYRVIRMDNRDVGRSYRFNAPPPGRLSQLLRRPREDGYDLADMAGDALALLDHLGVADAHVVGLSMGGMIAQVIAARHPARIRSLTSIFSTTGAPRVGLPALSTLPHLSRPPARSQAEYVVRHMRLVRHVAGPGDTVDEAAARRYAEEAWLRGRGPLDAQGVARQIGAIMKSGDRTDELRAVRAPTLVMHGDSDVMVHPSGGRATAAAIPDARLEIVPGMGHYLAPAMIPTLAERLARHAAEADAG